MKKYDVIIAEQADHDLRSIYEYIAYDLFSPENAERQLYRLEKSIEGLDTFPNATDLSNLAPGKAAIYVFFR